MSARIPACPMLRPWQAFAAPSLEPWQEERLQQAYAAGRRKAQVRQGGGWAWQLALRATDSHNKGSPLFWATV